jgi:DNA transformation protein
MKRTSNKRAGTQQIPARASRAPTSDRGHGRGPLRSLKNTSAFKTFVIEQLADLDDVVARAMFGGVGLYQRGVFFGIIAQDTLYLKVDDATRPDYARMGSHPFKPYPDRAGTMQYYAVPLAVLESAMDLTQWARKAVGVATTKSRRDEDKNTKTRHEAKDPKKRRPPRPGSD